MGKIVIAVHGGAGPDSDLIKQHIASYKEGLEEAARAGHTVLAAGGTALDAVEAAVNSLENNPLFNAGKGSALNENAEVEMDAAIMNGADLQCGAVTLVQNVKNPVTLARAVMEQTKHIYLGGTSALAFAKEAGTTLMPDAYFITEHSYQQFAEAAKEENNNPADAGREQLKRKEHGTVGAVALDRNGNLAAATSTGGLENKKSGRIGDSSIIGTGTYANNNTCAVSCTGDGEYLMQHVVAFHLAALVEYKGLGLQEASEYLIHEKCKEVKGDMGLISVNTQGEIGLAFNSERMHRAWIIENNDPEVFIYEKE